MGESSSNINLNINSFAQFVRENGFDVNRAAQWILSTINEILGNLQTLNIIVAGKSGAGKSTLINAVFKEKLAETGIGKPVTQHTKRITKEGVPLAIYDTKGLELSEEVQTQVKDEIIEIINKGYESGNIANLIHCIWYCINTPSNRIEPEEIELLRKLSNINPVIKVPIIVVLTQAFDKARAEKLKETLEKENLDIINIVPVLAEDYSIEGAVITKAFGLDILVEIMSQILPGTILNTFQNLQIVNLEGKKIQARKAVKTATAAAFGLCATPIPLSDCICLIPTQIGMIAAITACFGFKLDKSVLMTLISSTIGTAGATVLGKTIVTSLLKFIPGLGTATTVVSATTASAITYALGEAYIAILERVFKGEMKISDLNTDKGKEIMRNLFEENLKSSKKTEAES